MTIKNLNNIIYSTHGSLQFCILYSRDQNCDLENGCTFEYLVRNYGEEEVKRIQADDHLLVITI